ncbi:MAG: UPF0489 family protein [Candidatus Omnitrophota bacterium]
MNYKKSKFRLIFRIISLVLIQAFLVLDFAWAIGGEFPIADKISQAATLAPKISLNTQEVWDAYVYSSQNSAKINELSLPSDQPMVNIPNQSPLISRRAFFKTVGQKVIGAAAVLTGADLILSAPAEARDLTVALSDLVINFDKGVAEAELNKYIAIIEAQGFKELYSLEKKQAQTLIRIKGLFPLNAEKLSYALNAQAKARGLAKGFVVTASDASWKQSLTYRSMQAFANKVARLSASLGFGEIDSPQLIGLYEGITWVESKFNQWETDAQGRIRPVRSYTNAIGVTQVIESQAVKQIARWIVTHKGGISRYAEIMNELERMISSDSEKLKKSLKANKKFGEEAEALKQFNVYADFAAYKNAGSDIEKQKQIIQRIHRKINSNPKLIGVNLYYALAVWQYLQNRNNLRAGVTAELAESMGQTGQGLTRKNLPLIESGSGAYQPMDLEKAGLQFESDYFRLNLLYQMINPEKIAELLQGAESKILVNTMEYLSRQMMTKIGNQKLGYTYLTLNWDRYRRLELRKNKNNQYEFTERPLSYFQNKPNGFSVSLAAAASYNSGTGSVDDALLNFGNAVDANNLPLWIKNMIGANPQNIREPINYLRVFLEDKFNNTGDLSAQEQKIKNELIAERYKRVYKIQDRLLEKRALIHKNKVRIYAAYRRDDGFDYKLAAWVAQIAGSDYVDSFLRTHGLDKKWQEEILKSSQTLDILAPALADVNSPGYAAAVNIRRYLDSKQLASLAKRQEAFKSKEQARIARIELAKQISKEKQWQKTLEGMTSWAMRSTVGVASLGAAGAIAWIINRRVKLGKKPVPSLIYRLPLQGFWILGFVTVRLFAIVGKILFGTGKYVFSFFAKAKPRINKPRSALLADQKVVRNNRVKQAENRYKNKNRFFSIANLKKLILGSILLAIIAWPFASPAFSHASQKQAQAPPAISLSQEFKKGLIEISKKSDHKQLNAQGELTTIKANLKKNLEFSNSKARERVEQINQLAERNWQKAYVNGELDEYITKRGQSEDALAIGKALFILQSAAPEIYQGLKKYNASIYLAEIPFYGYARGSRVFGLGGKPMVFVNKDFLNNPFKIALVLSHEGHHAILLPKDLLESALRYNFFTFIRDVLYSIPQGEKEAFEIQAGVARVFYIEPIKGNMSYDPLDVEIAYGSQKWQIVGLDILGTGLFNVIPLIAGWLILKFFMNSSRAGKSRDYQRSGSGGLSNLINSNSRNNKRLIRKGRGKRKGNFFWSIILIPLLAFQFSSFLSPAITQASDVFIQPQEKTEITEYKNEQIINPILGTDLKVNSHFGPQEGKHNNALADWSEAVIRGVIQPNADIIHVDFHADDSGAVMDADMLALNEVKNLKTSQEKIQAVRDIAAHLRIDSFYYPAYLTGPTGQSILGTTFWVRPEAEWQGAAKEQYIVSAPYGTFPTDHPEKYPNDKRIKRYELNADDLSLVGKNAQLKNGFILDIDLDYFTLHREDMNWVYMRELLERKDEASQKLAKSILKTVHYQPTRQQLQKNIDLFIDQLAKLHERGIDPGIISVFESPNFTAYADAKWVNDQLVKGFKAIYGKGSALAAKDQKPKSAASSGWKKISIMGLVSVISASFANLFSVANLWAMENGADKAFASSDFKSIVTYLITIALIGFLVKSGLKALSLAKQKNAEQQAAVIVPSQAALDKLKKLDTDISALFAQGKTQVIIAFDGPSGAGKTTLANYIKAVGIAGIQPSEIQVLSRDDYAVGGDYNEANIVILEKIWHRGKLVIVEGNGIQWASAVLAADAAYANPDIFVKITAAEQLRKQRLLEKGLSESAASERIRTASGPDSGLFDIIIQDPYIEVNSLRKSAEYIKAESILRSYPNDSGLALIREFVLDQMLSSDRRGIIVYHNERHLNELFEFFDAISKHLPFKNKASAERLIRMAIYLHDLGYFYSEDGLLIPGHEQRSKDEVLEFVKKNPGILSAVEVQSIMYLIDKTQLKTGDAIKNEISDDNKTYDLLDRINNAQESGLTAEDQQFLASFMEKNFPDANPRNPRDRQLVLDTILGGKALALADIWGQDQTYLYQVALLSQEFRYDKQIMLNNNDPNAAKSPAAMSNLEQVGGSSGFQSFAQDMRFVFFLNSADYPMLGMQQYLDAEQKEKQAKGEKEKALIDRRTAMIEKSNQVQSLTNVLTSGVDENLNIIGLAKDTDQLPQVIALKEFIDEGLGLGIYDDAQKAQLISEINSRNGLIFRGIDNQFDLAVDAAYIAELAPTVDDILISSKFAEILSEQELAELTSSWEIKKFSPGQAIVQQDIPDAQGVFLILSGNLDVFVNGYHVGEIPQGELFGEMSVLDSALRSATVRVSQLASQQAVIAEIPAPVFTKLFGANRQLKQKIKALIQTRKENSRKVLDAEEEKDDEVKLKHKFESGQLDTVVFVDVDLMRLTNQYVAKKNVNVLLDVLETEFEKVIKALGAENAVSLRRGGDEFILAINSRENKQQAIDIAAKLKNNVQSAKFSLASIGTDRLSQERIAEIESFGCGIDTIGKHNIIIVGQKTGGKTGRACVQEFLDTVNAISSLKNPENPEAEVLSIQSSWLDQPAVNNEVSFTLSIGLANVSEIDNVPGSNLYEKARNFAAQRKDKSKEIFKKLGDGHIEAVSSFAPLGVAGESILLTEQAIAEHADFEQLQAEANRLEAEQMEAEQIPTGIRHKFAEGEEVLYFSSENAARSHLNAMRDNQELNAAIAFSLQGLGYYDQEGKIDQYKAEYYTSPGAVKDNRIDIRDFKVVNEAHGYVAGDEIIARLRIGAMRFARLFENFDLVFARGPPAGPNGFLIPKTKQAAEMNPTEVQVMFVEYMRQIRDYFNKPNESAVKVGQLRVVWDRVSQEDKNIGNVIERISQTRAVYEQKTKPKKGRNMVLRYDPSIPDKWSSLAELNAPDAVAQLENLKIIWQQNKQQLDAFANSRKVSGTLRLGTKIDSIDPGLRGPAFSLQGDNLNQQSKNISLLEQAI